MLTIGMKLQKEQTTAFAGSELHDFVEDQLVRDLAHYRITGESLRIDWSQSYGCGREARFLDGTLQNFSRIIVFDQTGELVADGCMDFISNKYFCLCYWELVTTWKNGKILREKKETGIPMHVWTKIPAAMIGKFAGRRAEI